jgi:hypothetical protein
MHPSPSLRLLAGCVALAGLVACSSAPVGPARAADVVSHVEQVETASETAKDRAQVAMDRLKAMLAIEQRTEAMPAYEEFVAAIDASEESAAEFRASIEAMRDAAVPLFEQWTADLEVFTNPGVRRCSQDRLMQTRGRFDAIGVDADPAQVAFDEFNRGLRDHALFFYHDWNRASVSAIEQETNALVNHAAELQTRLEGCRLAARAYVDASALSGDTPSPTPVASTPQSAGSAAGGGAGAPAKQ